MLKSYNCFVYFEAGRQSVQRQETEIQTGELQQEQPFRNVYTSKLAILWSLCEEGMGFSLNFCHWNIPDTTCLQVLDLNSDYINYYKLKKCSKFNCEYAEHDHFQTKLYWQNFKEKPIPSSQRIWVWSTRLIWYVCRLWDMVFSWHFEC